MLRIEYSRYGGPEVMHLIDRAAPLPKENEIAVRVKAASVNPIDWKVRNGDLKMLTGSHFPRGMGRDFAGLVTSVGDKVTQFKAGDAVFGGMELRDLASFAEVLVTPATTAALKPSELTFEQAGALATAGKTAWGAVVDGGKIKPGQRLFVNGCLGGVGRCAVQIGKMFAAEVGGTCSHADLVDATALGVDPAIDYHQFKPEDSASRYDIVLDTFGNLSTAQCAMMLRRGGIALHLSGGFSKILRVLLAPKNKFSGSKISTEFLRKVANAAAMGKLDVPIAKTVALRDAVTAITYLEQAGQPKGKLVIVPA